MIIYDKLIFVYKNKNITGEPFDKAGAYAIQGLGGEFVKRTAGSWTNVVGLPVEKVVEILQQKNWVLKK